MIENDMVGDILLRIPVATKDPVVGDLRQGAQGGGLLRREGGLGRECKSSERILSMLRHEITPSTSTKNHGHEQLDADMDEVDCTSRGRGRR